MLCNSRFTQLNISNAGVVTGITKLLWDVTLILPYNSDDQIFCTLLKYSLVTLSLIKTFNQCPHLVQSI